MPTIKIKELQAEDQPTKVVPKKKLKIKRLLLVVLAIVLIIVLVGFGVFACSRWQIQLANSNGSSDNILNSDNTSVATALPCIDILNPECWNQAFRPKLDQTNGKTTVLLLGVDTRASGNGSGLLNTDTIMMVTYYYDTNQARLLSFPRDLYAPYGCNADKLNYYTKINAIYAYGQYHCSGKTGAQVFSQTLEKISGEKINYVAIIHLEGVIKAIDAIGGVDVNIPKDHTDVYPYGELPTDLQKSCKRSKILHLYCIFSFKKGLTHMDGQTALIYARMREYSTDFDRARRQQEVLDAVKDKIKSDNSSLFDKASNLFNLYNSMTGSIDLKFSLNLEMVLAGLDIAKDYNSSPAKIILDPSFAGGGVIIKGSGSNFNFNDYSFKQVQDKLGIITKYMDLYIERPVIYVSNQTGNDLAKNSSLPTIKSSAKWFTNITIDKAKYASTSKTGVEIIDFSNGLKPGSIKYFTNTLAAETGDTVTVIQANTDNTLKASHKEDISINLYPHPAMPIPTLTTTP